MSKTEENTKKTETAAQSRLAKFESVPTHIKLVFGVTQGRTPEGKIRVASHTTLAMSPQHAKAVMRLLQRTIERYELDHMPLPMPSGDAEFEDA